MFGNWSVIKSSTRKRLHAVEFIHEGWTKGFHKNLLIFTVIFWTEANKFYGTDCWWLKKYIFFKGLLMKNLIKEGLLLSIEKGSNFFMEKQDHTSHVRPTGSFKMINKKFYLIQYIVHVFLHVIIGYFHHCSNFYTITGLILKRGSKLRCLVPETQNFYLMTKIF